MASVSIKFDDAALQAKLDALRVKLQEAVRPSAQAGAQILYDEVRLRVPISNKVHGYEGNLKAFKPGNLKASIYQVYSKSNSDDSKAVYQISYNKKKAFYGRFIEFGTVKLAGQSFIRPSYDSKKVAALEAVKVKFLGLAKGAINGA